MKREANVLRATIPSRKKSAVRQSTDFIVAQNIVCNLPVDALVLAEPAVSRTVGKVGPFPGQLHLLDIFAAAIPKQCNTHSHPVEGKGSHALEVLC